MRDRKNAARQQKKKHAKAVQRNSRREHRKNQWKLGKSPRPRSGSRNPSSVTNSGNWLNSADLARSMAILAATQVNQDV